MGEPEQYFPEKTTIPSEEMLIDSEYPRDQVKRNSILFKQGSIIIPEFIFDKDRNNRIDNRDEFPGISRCIRGKVTDMIGNAVILPYLIS